MKVNFNDKKFLLVEDSPLMRATIRGILSRISVRIVYEAKNAEMALMAMRKERFDIVLCDYNLGEGQNGLQLLEEAKFCKLLSHNAIFIMVTADNTQSMVLGVMENKPDDYLLKPFNAIQLINRLKKQALIKKFTFNIGKALDRDDLMLAIRHCDDLLRLNNHGMDTQLLKMRAELAIRVGDLHAAEQKFQQVLHKRDLPWARHGLGKIALLQNNFDLAIELFRQVIATTPMFLDSYDWLARAYEATNQNEAALGILNQAAELSPNSILRQQKLAHIAIQSDQIDIAKKAFKVAVDLGKFSVHKSSYDFFKLVKIYLKGDDKKQVNKLLADMRSQYGDDSEAQIQVAILEAEFYHAEKNVPMLTKAHEKIDKMQSLMHDVCNDLQLNIAKTLLQTGSVKIAAGIINRLIINNVDDEKFLNGVREIAKSSYDMEKLIEDSKQELLSINNTAVSLFREGNSAEALAILVEATEKMPYNKTILLNMITILLMDMKTHGADKEKLSRAKTYIHKADQLGVSQLKVNQLQLEFSKIAHSYY